MGPAMSMPRCTYDPANGQVDPCLIVAACSRAPSAIVRQSCGGVPLQLYTHQRGLWTILAALQFASPARRSCPSSFVALKSGHVSTVYFPTVAIRHLRIAAIIGRSKVEHLRYLLSTTERIS